MKTRILKRDVLAQNRIYRLVRSVVRLPGREPMVRDTVEHPGAVSIVPLLPGKRVVLIRQYRFAVRGGLWEIPAGTLEKGEPPVRCAHRELMEEIGYRAGRLEKLAVFYTAPGFCDERMHLYLGRDLRPERRAGDPDEIIRPSAVPLATALRWIGSGCIRDAKTIVGLYLAAKRLRVD